MDVVSKMLADAVAYARSSRWGVPLPRLLEPDRDVLVGDIINLTLSRNWTGTETGKVYETETFVSAWECVRTGSANRDALFVRISGEFPPPAGQRRMH